MWEDTAGSWSLTPPERRSILNRCKRKWRVFDEAFIEDIISTAVEKDGPKFDPARSRSYAAWISYKTRLRLTTAWETGGREVPSGLGDGSDAADDDGSVWEPTESVTSTPVRTPDDVGVLFLERAAELVDEAHPDEAERTYHLRVALVAVALSGLRRTNAGPAALRRALEDADCPEIEVGGRPASQEYMRGLLVETIAIASVAAMSELPRMVRQATPSASDFRRWWTQIPPDPLDEVPNGFPDKFIEAVLRSLLTDPSALLPWESQLDELPDECWRIAERTRRRRSEMLVSVQHLAKRAAQYLYDPEPLT